MRKTVSAIMLTLLLTSIATLAFNIQSAKPAPSEVQVGVKAGDWIKCDYTISGWPAGQPYPEWLKVEFLTVEGTNATVRVTMHVSDGTEQNATVPVIIGAGGGEALGLSGFVIPANLTTGDSVYISGYGNVTIAGETTRVYAGASRTVVYTGFFQYGTHLTYYWDKLTGVMVEASATSGDITATAKATETNMWQAETIYIRADGSIDPPTAPISTNPPYYTLYTFTDSIHDSILVERDNIVIDGAGHTLQGTEVYESKGIYLSGRTNVTVRNTQIKNFFFGICLYGSSNNSMSGNNVTDNRCGIDLWSSSNNSMSGNTITNNGEGIYLRSSNYNSISGNTIANNDYGIELKGSSNNSIFGNNIKNNRYSIRLGSSSNNRFWHNNFIDNAAQVYDDARHFPGYSPSINAWDDGYPSGGNYWSDYTGVDLYSGPFQNEPGSDGIGDTPYIIQYIFNANNTDRYPLMNPWTPSWVPPEQPPPTPAEVQVGVEAGDWIKVDYTITGWPAGTPYPLWLKVEFLSVEGTSATVRVTMHMSNGTEQNATVPVDVVAGGQALGLSGFVIPANLTTGDSVYISGYGNVTIAGETTRTYAGASRTVIYASFSQYGTQLTYYWDKQTGVMVEAFTTSGGVTATAKATETNMWQPAPAFPVDPLMLIYASIATVTVIVIAIFLVRRKKKPPEGVENSQSKLRLTPTGFKRNFGHRITRV